MEVEDVRTSKKESISPRGSKYPNSRVLGSKIHTLSVFGP